MVLPEPALGSVPPSEDATQEHPAGASGTRLKVAARPATVGATWMDLFHPGTPSPPSLEARVRVIADIAGALIQIHDNSGLPRPHRRHGRLTPRHLLVGVDGSASLFNAREPFSKLLPPQPDLGYLAPELLTQSGPATQQSDVFSLGALLWEALDNGRLFPHRRAAAISRLIARRSLPVPRVEEEWALPLGDVAMKALSQNPDDRYLDGTAFWLALREHLPAPDAARQALSKLAQRALKLELTTDIRDEPPYLASRVHGLGASSPPLRSSFDDDPEPEAPARYSLHPERSSRDLIPSQAPPDAAAWRLSEPPPRSSRVALDAHALALAAQPSRSRPAGARPSAPPRSERASAPPPTPGPRYSSQPPPRHDADSPISTLHVNLPRELIDASLPYYVSGQPTARAFPWGILSFAALMFFGVGAAVAFGAVTALRAPPIAAAAHETVHPGNAPAAEPLAPVNAPSPIAPAPAAPPAIGVVAAPAAPASDVAAPAAPSAPPEPAPAVAPAPSNDPSVGAIPGEAPSTIAKGSSESPTHKPPRRPKPAKPKRAKPATAAPAAEAEAAPAPDPSSDIVRDLPEDQAPGTAGAESGDGSQAAPAEGLPFVEQPY